MSTISPGCPVAIKLSVPCQQAPGYLNCAVCTARKRTCGMNKAQVKAADDKNGRLKDAWRRFQDSYDNALLIAAKLRRRKGADSEILSDLEACLADQILVSAEMFAVVAGLDFHRDSADSVLQGVNLSAMQADKLARSRARGARARAEKQRLLLLSGEVEDEVVEAGPSNPSSGHRARVSAISDSD